MLYCVAMCCSVAQCVAVCCSVLQCVVVCCTDATTTHSCVAVCCSVLQRVVVCRTDTHTTHLCVAVCCSVLQRVAACCSVLQCIAVCCSVLLMHTPHIWSFGEEKFSVFYFLSSILLSMFLFWSESRSTQSRRGCVWLRIIILPCPCEGRRWGGYN